MVRVRSGECGQRGLSGEDAIRNEDVRARVGRVWSGCGRGRCGQRKV